MSLNVPLTVRIGGRHVTQAVSGVKYKVNAVGGVESITLKLIRRLDSLDTDLAGLAKVYIYDSRSAETLAEGRVSDIGRSASTEGQTWDLTAFGPAQHASDKRFPYIMVDQRQDTYVRASASTKNATNTSDERDLDTPSLVIAAEEGKTISTSWVGELASRALRNAGMKIGAIRVLWDAGLTDANYRVLLGTRLGSGSITGAATATANTAGGTLSAQVTTHFANGQDVAILRADRNTSAATGAETHWFEFWDIRLSALRLDKTGAEITTGASYTSNFVTANQVVEDLLGRALDQYDGAGATVTTNTYAIDQLAYPDGVTPAEVLADLMELEPSMRWTTGPSNSLGKYAFSWVPWPTSVRYEATLEDGGTFPASTQELFNGVTVRYRDAKGITRSTALITGACPALDAAGITRYTMIDAADEIGSAAGAAQLAAGFLADHKYPANAGTLTISRPIRDLVTGAMVLPQEIKPGELIRVRGIESYPDALNASSNDGLTVFRIWTMEFDSDTNSATLELDSYSRTVANALAGLMKRRTRKR